jgi:hypothetical protein
MRRLTCHERVKLFYVSVGVVCRACSSAASTSCRRAGETYPATLITTAENDLRVVPAHAMKLAAALQAANAGPHPILLCIDNDGGHGVGIPVRQRIDALSKVLAFLLQALALKKRLAESA